MRLKKIFLDSPLFFECPVSGEVIIDEENYISNVPSRATEFIFYDGEFEFQKDWVENAYKNDLADFLKSELEVIKNIICYELVIGSGVSLERVYVGVRT